MTKRISIVRDESEECWCLIEWRRDEEKPNLMRGERHPLDVPFTVGERAFDQDDAVRDKAREELLEAATPKLKEHGLEPNIFERRSSWLRRARPTP